MDKRLRTDLKRITALVLSTAMIIGSNGVFCLESTYAKETAVDEIIVEEAAAEEIIVEETTSDEIIIEEAAVDEIVAEEEGIVAEEVVAEEVYAAAEASSSDEYIQLDKCSNSSEDDRKYNKFGELLSKFLYIEMGNFNPSTGGTEVDFSRPKERDILETFNIGGTKSYIGLRTSLKIGEAFQEEIVDGGTIYHGFNKVENWGGLRHFSNVKSLTIEGVEEIKSIEFPKSITSLTIKNCKFNGEMGGTLNLNKYVSLNSITFVNNSGINEIKLNELTTLKEVNITDKNITKLEFSNTVSDEASGGLVFSAAGCTNLESISFGGYQLTGGKTKSSSETVGPNFSECSKLKSISINGITNSQLQTINISKCTGLKNLYLSYRFVSENNEVKIIAKNIYPSDGDNTETITFSRAAGSAKGFYVMEAINKTFLMNYAKANYGCGQKLFSGIKSAYETAKYVVFREDIEYYIQKAHFAIWDEPKREDYGSDESYDSAVVSYNGKIRNYENKPIILKVGEKIKNNSPVFLAEDGTLMENYTSSYYTVKIEQGKNGEARGKIPSELNADEKVSYNVIKAYNTKTGVLKVKALNPGVAYLTVTSNKEGVPLSTTQKIIVVDPVESVTVGQCAEYYGSGGAQKHYIDVTIKTQYPSLSEYAIATPHWQLYKKNSEGKYEEYHSWTEDAITVNTSYETKEGRHYTDGSGIHNEYLVDIYANAVGGDLYVSGNFCTNGNVLDKVGDRQKEVPVSFEAGQEHKFAIGNMSSSSVYLGYNGISFDKFSPSITFKIPNLDTSTYDITTPKITEANAYNYLKIDNKGNGEYELKFRDDVSSNKIAEYLKSKGKESKIEVTASIGTKGGTPITYKRTIYIAGRFDISYYNEKGGTAHFRDVLESYYIPDYYTGDSVTPIYSWNVYGDTKLWPSLGADGYTFKGWYSSEYNRMVTKDDVHYARVPGNLDLEAKWEPIKYTISYDMQGGTNPSTNPTWYTIESDTFTLAAPTREGANFLGWSGTDIEVVSSNTVVTVSQGSIGNRSYKATWDKEYTPPAPSPSPSPSPTPTPDPEPVTPVEPIKDPETPTTGDPVKDEKTGGDYVVPDPTKNEVVYKAPPADDTKKTVTIPDKIVVDGKEMDVVKIDPGAFKNNDNVKTINVGKNIETIGAGAFEGASNLTKVTLGKNVETIGSGAFKDCESLKTVTIPAKTTEIGDGAFEGCKSLTSIKLGSSVKEIGDGAFKDCTALKKVTVPAKATEIGDGAFEGCKKLSSVTLGKSVTEIGDGAFKDCTSLKTVTIPSKTKEIGDGAFEGDKKLTKVTIGKNVEEIGDGAFKNCKSLTSLSIPSKASKIGEGAFEGCSKLTTLKISSKNLTSASIDAGAFSGLTKKTTIKVPKSKLKEYKELFKEKGIDPKVKIKGY